MISEYKQAVRRAQERRGTEGFRRRFKGRTTLIGKDGHLGMFAHSSIPIQKQESRATSKDGQEDCAYALHTKLGNQRHASAANPSVTKDNGRYENIVTEDKTYLPRCVRNRFGNVRSQFAPARVLHESLLHSPKSSDIEDGSANANANRQHPLLQANILIDNPAPCKRPLLRLPYLQRGQRSSVPSRALPREGKQHEKERKEELPEYLEFHQREAQNGMKLLRELPQKVRPAVIHSRFNMLLHKPNRGGGLLVTNPSQNAQRQVLCIAKDKSQHHDTLHSAVYHPSDREEVEYAVHFNRLLGVLPSPMS